MPQPPQEVAAQLVRLISTARRTNSEALEIVSVPGEVHVDFVEAGVGVGFALPAEIGSAVYDWISSHASESENLDMSTCGGKGSFKLERFIRLDNPGVRIHIARARERAS